MDTLGSTLAKQLSTSGEPSKEIVQSNIALEVALLTQENINYPRRRQNANQNDANTWLYETQNRISVNWTISKGLYMYILYNV